MQTDIYTQYPNLQDFIPQEYYDGKPFLEHLFSKIDQHISSGGRILVLTLTKKSSEEIANFLISKGYKTYYLHSEISTIERRDIIQKLRAGDIDILVGINLLREGIDIPEVSLIAMLDADKEGFLRSTTALIQNIGRAARNPNSEVILYADHLTESIIKALYETYRRRHIQMEYNLAHDISPTQAISNIKKLDSVKTDENLDQAYTSLHRGKNKKLKKLSKKEKAIISAELHKQLQTAITAWDFEKAATLRDQLKELEEE